MHSPIALLALALVTFGVACSPITISNNSIDVPHGGTIKINDVNFEYPRFSNQDAAFLAKVREQEGHVRELLTKGFDRGARASGLDEGTFSLTAENPFAGVFPVRIAIKDLDPDQRIVEVIAICRGGTLQASARLEPESDMSFDDLLVELGFSIADSIASKTHDSAL